MNTDERIHAYCRNPDTINYLEDKQKLIQRPQSSHLIKVNTELVRQYPEVYAECRSQTTPMVRAGI
jgi:hypothetical protein